MKNSSLTFYIGTLISSIGSMVFSAALIPFLFKEGVDLTLIGFILGSGRLGGALFALFLSPKLEQLSPKNVTIVTEVLASIASLGIFRAITSDSFKFYDFIFWYYLRALTVNLQNPMKAKIAKVLSASNPDRASYHASMLNNVTQGATLFAGLSTLFAIETLHFSNMVLFDMVTFLVSGIALLVLGLPEQKNIASHISFKVWDFFRNGATSLYRSAGLWAGLDLVLAIALAGTTMLFARLANQESHLIPAFFVVYGLAVWISAPLSKCEWFKKNWYLAWPALGISYVVLGTSQGVQSLVFSFVKDLIYWLLLHHISARILHKVPLEQANVAHSFRQFQMIAILSVGEFVVGMMASKISVFQECSWRAFVCLLVSLYLWKAKKDVE